MKRHYLREKIFAVTRAQEAFCRDFEIKTLGEYHNLYVQSNTLWLTDVFNKFRNICFEICLLDPARFLSAPELAEQPALKNTKVKLDLLTDINMLLIIEKSITGEICHAFHRRVKANNKIRKKIKNGDILDIGM